MDDFNDGTVNNQLGAGEGTFGPVGAAALDFVSTTSVGNVGFSRAIAYDASGGASGYFSGRGSVDYSAFRYVSFWVRGQSGGENAYCTVDDGVNFPKAIIGDFLPDRITNQWQKVVMSTAAFGAIDWGVVPGGAFKIEANNAIASGAGTVYIDDIRFGSRPAPIWWDNFNDGAAPFNYGMDYETFITAQTSATLTPTYDSSIKLGTTGYSYKVVFTSDTNSSSVVLLIPSTGTGIDITGTDTLSFQIQGDAFAQGNDLAIGIKDVPGVEGVVALTSYEPGGIPSSFKEVRIPVSDLTSFAPGLDKTRVRSVDFWFQRQAVPAFVNPTTSYAINLDNIQFIDTSTPTAPTVFKATGNLVTDGMVFNATNSFTANADDGATDPTLEEVRFEHDGLTGGASWYTLGTDTDTSDTLYGTTWYAETLPRGTSYQIRAVATDVQGNVSYDGPFTVEICTITPNAPTVTGFAMYRTSATVALGLNGNPPGQTLEITTGAFETSSSSFGRVTTLTLFNLAPNTTYTIQARAVSGDLASSATPVASTATYADDPGALSVFAVAADSVSVSWGANGNPLTPPTSYQVLFSTDIGFGVFSASDTFDLTASSAGLLSDTSYYVRVRAYNRGGGTSGFDAAVATYTLADAPGFSGFRIFTTSASASILSNNDPAGTQYRFLVSTDGFVSVAFSSVGLATDLTVQGLQPNTTVQLAVDALNFSGVPSTTTLVASTSTLAAAPGPGSFVGISGASITVSWGTDGNPLTPPTSYQMQVSTSGDFVPFTSSDTFLVQASSTGLSPNATYWFRVRAYGRGGDISDFDAAISTKAGPNPPSVSDYHVFATSLTVLLGLNGNPPGIAFSVSTGDFAVSDSSSGPADVSITTLTISGLISNHLYPISVRAFDNTPSAVVVVAGSTPTSPVDIASTSFTFVGASSVTFTWDPNGNSLTPPTSYEMQFSSNDFSFSFASVTFLTTATADNLIGNASYFFHVRPYALCGCNTAFSSPLSTMTLASLPLFAGLTGADVGISSVAVSWDTLNNSTNTLYEVDSSTSADFVPSVTVSTQGGTGASVPALSPDTTYHFRIRARNDALTYTDYSADLSTCTLASSPGYSFAHVSSDSVHVVFSPNGDPPGTTFRLQVSFDGFATVSFSSEGASTDLTVTGLTPNQGPFDVGIDAVDYQQVPSSRTIVAASTGTLAAVPTAAGFQVFTTSVTASLNWNNSPVGTMFAVSTGTGGDFSVALSSAGKSFFMFPPNQTSLTVFGLTPATVYGFQGGAWADVNGSTQSTIITVTTSTLANPPVITGFQVFATSVAIIVGNNSNPAGTAIAVSTGNGGDFGVALSSLGVVAGADTTLFIPGLTPNTTYNFQAGAWDGTSGASTMTTIVTASTRTLAAAPQVVGFSVFTTSATIILGPNGNPAGTALMVSTGSDGNYATALSSVGAAGAGNVIFTLTGLTTATVYALQAGARDDSVQAATQTAIVTASTSTLAVAPVVAGFQVFATSAAITLGDNTNPVGTAIVVSTGTGGHFGVALSSLGVVAGANTTLVIGGLTPNTVYGFQAGARDSTSGASTMTVLVTASTNTLAAAPTIAAFRIFATSASFTLAANGNPAGTALMVSTGTSGDYGAALSSVGVVAGANTTFVIGGLTPNTNYGFEAGARDGSAQASTQTALVSVSTQTLAALPAVVGFQVFTTSISVTLGANGNPAGTHFSVSTGTGGDFAVIDSSAGVTPGSDITFFLTGLTTAAFYAVQAGSWDDSVQAATQAAVVTASTYTLAGPPIVTGFKVFATSVAVSVDGNGNAIGTALMVSTGTDGNYGAALSSVAAIAGANTTVILSGLTPNTVYAFQTGTRGLYVQASTLSVTVTPSTNTLAAVPTVTGFRIFTTSLSVTLGSNGNPVGTALAVSTGSGGDFGAVLSSAGVVGGANTTLVLTGLTTATVYSLQAGAWDGSVQAATQAAVVAASTSTLAVAPSFIGFAVYATSAVITVGANTDPLGTAIVVSTGSGGDFAVASASAGVVAGADTPLVISGLIPDTVYAFQAGAHDSTPGASTRTVLVTASTNTLAAPPVVTGFQVFATSASVTLASNGNPAGTALMVSTGADGNFGLALSSVGTVAGANTTLTVFGLTPNTAYSLQAGARDDSALASTQTVIVASTHTLAAVPAIVGFRIFTTSATVLLGSNGNPNGTRIAVSTGSGGDFSVAETSVGAVPDSILVLSGLTPDTPYAFQAGAWDDGSQASTQAAVVTLSTRTLAAPPMVAGFRVFATSVSVTLGSNGNPSGTVLLVSTGAGGDFGVGLSSIGAVAGTNTTLVIGGLTPNTGYAFQAGSRDGTAQASTQAVAVTASTNTLAAVPAIAGFRVFTTSLSVTLGSNGNPIGTPLMVSTGTGGDFGAALSSVGAVAGVNTTLVLTGLSTATFYGVQAGARDFSAQAATQTAAVTASTSTLASAPIVSGFRVFSTSITVLLDPNGNPAGTGLGVSTGAGGNFSVALSSVGAAGGSPTSLTISGLAPNTVYAVQAGAWDGTSGASTQTVAVTASTNTSAAPPSVVGFRVFETSAVFTLGPNGDPAGTRFAVSTGSAGDFSVGLSSVGSSAGGNVTLALSGLTPSTVYAFQAGAWDAGVQADTQAVVVTASTGTLAAPPTVTGFQIFATSATVTLGSNGNPVGTALVISTGAAGDFSVALSSVGAVTGANTSLTLTGLTPNTLYALQAGARDSTVQASTQSAVVTASTRTLAAPPAVTSFRIFTTSAEVVLNPNGNPAGTLLAVSTGAGGNFGVALSSIGAALASDTTFVLSGLTPATSYGLQAGAWDDTTGASTRAVLVTASTQTLAAPPTVTAFRIFSASVSVTLASNGNPVGTPLMVSTGTGGDFGVSLSSIGAVAGANTTLVLGGLTPATFYGLQAGARGGIAGASTATVTVSASTSTLAARPAVAGFQVFATSVSISLGSNGNPAGTSLAVSTGSGGDFAVGFSSAGASDVSGATLTLTGLTPNTVYAFQAGAWDGTAGASTQSASVSASTNTLAASPTVTGFQVFTSSILVTLGSNGNPLGTALLVSTGTGGDFGVNLSSIGAVAGANTTLALAGLSTATVYGIQAGARDQSVRAATQTVIVTASTSTLAAPPAIVGFQIFATSISVTLGSNGNSVGTALMLSTGSAGDFGAALSSFGVVAGANTVLTISGLTPNTSYAFQAGARENSVQAATQTVTVAASTSTLAARPAVAGFEVFATSVSVFLNPNGNPAGTSLTVSTGSGGNFSVSLSSAGAAGAGLSTLTISGLTPDTNYALQAGAVSSFVQAATQAVSVTASTQTLAVPPAVLGFDLFLTSAAVQLDPLTNPAGTRLLVSTGTGGDFGVSLSSFGANPGGPVTLTIAGLSTNTVYGFQAAAANAGAPASTTTAVTVTFSTTTDAAAPGSGSFVQVGVSSIVFSWAANGNPLTPPTSYQAQISTSSDFVPSVSSVTFLTQASFTGLSADTSYYFRANAFDRFGAATAFDPAVSTPTLPQAPALIGFQVFATSVAVTLDPGSNPSGTVLSVSSGAFEVSSSSSGASAGGPVTLVLPNLIANRAYDLQARASGYLGASSSSTVVASTATLPAVPGAIQLTAVSDVYVTLAWGNNGNSLTPPTSYQVQISSNDPSFSSFTSSDTFSLNLTTSGLSNNTTYYLRVFAWGVGGSSSAFDSPISTVTLPFPLAIPSTPTALTVLAVYSSSMTLGWADNSNNESGFDILNSTDGLYGSAGISSTFTTIIGLTPNSLVTARVAAFNGVGASTGPTVISSYTLAAIPGAPSFVSTTRNSASFDWAANGNSTSTFYEVSDSTDPAFAASVSTPVSFGVLYTQTSATVGGLARGGTYYFRVRARNLAGVISDYGASNSTATPSVDIFLSTGGLINLGPTTLRPDAGILLLVSDLTNGATQVTFTSTQAAIAVYGNGVTLQLPAGDVFAVATATGVVFSSTQTTPAQMSGTSVQVASGTLTLTNTPSFVSACLSSGVLQDMQVDIPANFPRTLEVCLDPDSGVLKADLPALTFSDSVRFRLHTITSFPQVSGALRDAPEFRLPGAPAPQASPSFLTGLGLGAEVILDKTLQPQQTVTLAFGYRPQDIGSTDPDILVVGRFEESVQKWIPLPTEVYTSSRTVVALTRHFSKFQLMSLAPATDVNEVKIYPNPLRFYQGHTDMAFTNMSAGASVKIYNLAGERVRSLDADATGTARWNGRNETGDKVSSGVYVALIVGNQSSKIVRIAVEK